MAGKSYEERVESLELKLLLMSVRKKRKELDEKTGRQPLVEEEKSNKKNPKT